MTYKRWNKIGTEKKWLVITPTDSTTTYQLKPDTVYLDSIREVVIEKIDSVLFLDSVCFCVDSVGKKTRLPAEKKKQIADLIKNHDSKVQKSVFKDTLDFVSPNGNRVKIYNDSSGLKVNWIEKNCVVNEENWQKFIPHAVIVLFAGIIIGVWLTRK